MGRKKTTGARYGLGEPWDGMLSDFSAAHYNAPESQIIREAIEALIEAETSKNPGVQERYNRARKARLAALGKVAHLKSVSE